MNFAVNTISSNDIVASVQGQAPGACAQMHMLWYNSNSTIAVAGHEGDCDPFLGGNNPFAAVSVLEYDWNVPNGWTWSSTYNGYVDNAEVEISPSWGTNPNVGDQVYIGVRARNGCGWSNWQYNYWVVVSGGGGMFLSISPNPTSGETILSIESGSPEEATLKSTTTESAFDENTEWDLEVYNNMQSLKLKKQKLKGKSTIINTQSWKEGVYMVRVKYKDEMLTGKLMVNK